MIAESAPVVLDLEVPASVDYDTAMAASRGYPWFNAHPFPMCFVCGPQRSAGDGLRIFPGRVEGREVAAAPWVPDASLADGDGFVRPAFVWAALDCPSWFGYYEGGPIGDRALLGRLAASIRVRPRPGEPCVVIGWQLATDGRKIHCGSALLSESAAVLACAKATWITLAPR